MHGVPHCQVYWQVVWESGGCQYVCIVIRTVFSTTSDIADNVSATGLVDGCFYCLSHHCYE
jgi:hypothetical protein